MTIRHPVVHAVIVDMDNTLYDWVAYFVPAMRAMLAQAVHDLDTDERALRDDLRQVHIKYGNTEHPFALLETRTVKQRLHGLTARQRYEALRPAFQAFNEVRDQQLRLYPTVAPTLRTIRETGCRAIGHTEATNVNIASRARMLGLESTLDAIYAPKFEGPPHPLGDNRVDSAPPLPVVALPPDARKPNPDVAGRIATQLAIPTARCLYVGDSLAKDVIMAKSAGMLTAWARYGTDHDAELWAELVTLSHWDGPAVASARAIESSQESINPDVTLDSFDELLGAFAFGAPDACNIPEPVSWP